MSNTKIIVKLQSPTIEIDESDESDFEILSDSGNDEMIQKGYERLHDSQLAEQGVQCIGNEEKKEAQKPEVDQNNWQLSTEKIKLDLTQHQITKLPGLRTSVSCTSLAQTPDFSAIREVEHNIRFIDRLNSLLTPGIIPETSTEMGTSSSTSEKRFSETLIEDVKLDWMTVSDSEQRFSAPSLIQEEIPNILLPYRTMNNLNYLTNIETCRTTSQKETNNDLTEFLSEKFKCGICKCLYRDPRVLNCLHSFCLHCLTDYDKNGLSAHFWRKYSNSNSEFDWNYGQDSSFCESVLSNGTEKPSMKPSTSSSSSAGATKIKSISQQENKNKYRARYSKDRRRSSTALYVEKPKIIICSTCGFSTEIPLGGYCRLPQNYILMRQIDIEVAKTGTQQVARIWCLLCSSESIATCYCSDCGINLCNFCKEAHKRQRSTCSHEIRMFINPKKAKKTESTKQMLKCPMHISSDLKIFCTVCNQVVCNDCTILLHQTHKCITLAKASRVYMKMLNENLERTKPLTDYAFHSKVKMNEISKKINQKCEHVQNEVEIFLAEYFQALEVHRKTLLSQINRARENKIELILARQTDLERRCQEAKSAINFTEELLLNGSDIEKLSLIGILVKRFEHCQKSQTSAIDAKVSDSLEFLSEVKAPSNKAQNNIPLYGIITTQTASPKCCCLEKTEGLMNLRVHRKAELILISKDSDDRQMCHGGLTINIDLRSKDSSGRQIPTQISDRRDGTYTISFTPDSAGILLLTITINGKDIKESPFTLRSTALRPHSGIYHCCTFCSSNGSKTSLCACGSRMPGGFHGCGHGHPGHPGRRHWSCCSSVLENSECSVSNAIIYQSHEMLDH